MRVFFAMRVVLILPDNTLNTVKIMVKAVAKQERKNLQAS
jgi:hypothetical protein